MLNNRLKSVMLLAALTAMLLGAGQFLGGKNGLVIGILMAGVMNFVAYWFSDRIVLSMYRAKPLTPNEEPGLYGLVQRLATQHGLPMPKLYLIPESAPNAFATGRSPSHAAVAVTAGLLELLDRRELEGVLAHELGHIKNRDTLVSTIAAALAGALGFLAEMAMWRSVFGGNRNEEGSPHPLVGLIGMLLAPLAGLLIQSAISRSREFMADETGAVATGDPLALASALKKIEAWAGRMPMHQANPATAALFIINPLKGARMAALFSTHPPTKERVKRLETLAMGGFHAH